MSEAETKDEMIARLVKERDVANELQRQDYMALTTAMRNLREARASLSSMTERCKELEEALEPFARAHNRRPFINDTHPDYDKEFSDEQAGLTWGDLRAAARALSQTTKEGTE